MRAKELEGNRVRWGRGVGGLACPPTIGSGEDLRMLASSGRERRRRALKRLPAGEGSPSSESSRLHHGAHGWRDSGEGLQERISHVRGDAVGTLPWSPWRTNTYIPQRSQALGATYTAAVNYKGGAKAVLSNSAFPHPSWQTWTLQRIYINPEKRLRQKGGSSPFPCKAHFLVKDKWANR